VISGRKLLAASAAFTLGCALLAVAGGQSPAGVDTGPRLQRWEADSRYLATVGGLDVPGGEGAILATASEVCRTEGWEARVAVVVRRHQVPRVVAERVVDAAQETRCPAPGSP
jgi:hypothetical protein